MHHTRYRESRVVRLRGTDWEFEPGSQDEDGGETEGRASGKGVARQMKRAFAAGEASRAGVRLLASLLLFCLQLLFMCADLVGTGLQRCRNGG